jgi:SAM-dependent methyltransferase
MAQTPEQLRQHFEIERELADRLRQATKDERRALYREVYAERSARIPHHPLVAAARDAAARATAIDPQTRLLHHFVTEASSLLEVGAGDGAVARSLSPDVLRSVAVDVTDALARDLRSPPNFEFLEFDGFEIPLPDGSIDLVYSNDVVEHLHPDDLPDHLAEVRRVLAPRGRYLCITPNRLSGPHDVSRHFGSTARGFHLREYTGGELVRLFRVAGFSRVDVVISVRGHVIAPILPARLLALPEGIISSLPTAMRRRAARSLAAVKIIAGL